MGTVWRLQTRTDSNDGKKISTYCREKSIAAVGWSINDDQIKKYNAEAFDKIQSIRASIKSKDIYYKVLDITKKLLDDNTLHFNFDVDNFLKFDVNIPYQRYFKEF